MGTTKGGRLSYANVTASLALIVAVGQGVVSSIASIPGADGTIRGCYHKKKGTLRVVDEGVACKSKEESLVWNQEGVPGEIGAKGDQGDPGEPGAPATTLWAVVESDGTITASSGVTGIVPGAGFYTLTFNRDVTTCAVLATLITPGGHGMIRKSTAATGAEVQIRTADATGAQTAQAFSVAVIC
jgi:hypothetical protein